MRYKTLLIVLVFVASVDAQWKSRPQEKVTAGESLIRTDGGGLLFGWFDPSKFAMRQSYSLSYSSFGGHGISIGEYVNSMQYQLADPLSLRVDVSLTHSPYNSFGDAFGRDLLGIRISRAELNYRPAENTLLQIQFRQFPAAGYLSGYRNPWYSSIGFERFSEDDR